MKTTNLFSIFIFATILSINSFSQPSYQWAKNFGGTITDRGRDITIDGNGNTYIIGDFFGTADFDPGAGTVNLTSNGYDIFFAKYDSNGNYIWANKIGSASNQERGNSIVIDGSGNVYITGVFGGTADFDPGAGTANLSAVGGSEDIFFAKYDANGNYLWAKNVGSTTYDYGASIVVDAGGSNVYITGYFSGTADFDPGAGTANLAFAGGNGDIFFAKYDFNGNYVWAKGIGSTSADGGNAITVDGSGNVYITGYFYNTADFDPGAGTANLISNGSGDVFFAKYDSNGNYLWSNGIGGNSITVDDMGNDIVVDGSGNVYIIGYFGSTTDFDPGVGTANLFSFGFKDIFFGKYDSNGNYLWAKGIGSTGTDAGTRISVGTNGNVYITGYFSNTADFDPSGGTTNLTSAGLEDIFYSQYTPSGFFLCATSIGAVNSDYGNSIVLDASDNVYMAGYFQNTADFNPGAGTNNLTSAGAEDVFFLKYTPCVSLTIPSIFSQNVLCNGQCTGTATANPSGGTSPYTYNWDNGQTTQTATGLCAVIYTVTVTDAASSVATGIVSITQPSAISITITSNPATCGNSNGSANASVSGGITPYSFLWNSGQTTATATGLVAGSYTVIVTDAPGCTKTSVANVSNTGGPTVSIASQANVSCNGGNNGSATASVTGGTPPYTYVWSATPVQTTVTATGLLAGNYNVTVTDATGCVSIASVPISQPTALTVNTSQTNVSCSAGNNGSATVTVSGGTPAYTYLWNNGQTTSTATGLFAVNYTITITDANGCVKTATVSITQPPSLSNSMTIVNESFCGANDGSVSATVSGGTAPYSYSWSNGQTTSMATGLSQGAYIVTITDVNGCTLTPSAANVSCPNAVAQYSLENEFIAYPNPTSGVFNLPAKQFENMQLKIYTVYGEKAFEQIMDREHETVILDLPNGIYFICLKSEKESFTQKLIIQK